jgi:hypothetical protein
MGAMFDVGYSPPNTGEWLGIFRPVNEFEDSNVC